MSNNILKNEFLYKMFTLFFAIKLFLFEYLIETLYINLLKELREIFPEYIGTHSFEFYLIYF